MDFYLMYSTSGFSGWISYSLLKAEQKMYNDSYGYFPRNTDQRQTISAVADLDLGKNWNVSTRLVYGSGYAFTPSTLFIIQQKNMGMAAWKSKLRTSSCIQASRFKNPKGFSPIWFFFICFS